jgi:hypothetical protein
MTVMEMEFHAGFESLEKAMGEKIDSKMKPIYWAVAIMLGIFISISFPLTLVVIAQQKDLGNKAEQTAIEQLKKERETDYVKKTDYYLMEEDEHRVLKEIFKNPTQSDYLIGVINANIREQLGFKFTTRGEEKK